MENKKKQEKKIARNRDLAIPLVLVALFIYAIVLIGIANYTYTHQEVKLELQPLSQIGYDVYLYDENGYQIGQLIQLAEAHISSSPDNGGSQDLSFIKSGGSEKERVTINFPIDYSIDIMKYLVGNLESEEESIPYER